MSARVEVTTAEDYGYTRAEVEAIEADVAAKAAERERNRQKSALWRETVAERNREWSE